MEINSSTGTAQETDSVKKPYEKPSFRFDKVFVTSALNCAKAGGFGQCAEGNPKVS